MSKSTPEILEGTKLPDIDVLSPRVAVALGQNPSRFTGPGTNTYLVGTGPKRFLLDTGSGHDEYMPVLEEAIARVGCKEIEGIVLTHAHPDHIGGVNQVHKHFGSMPVYKLPWPTDIVDGAPGMKRDATDSKAHANPDTLADGDLEVLEDGDVIETEGAHLRAIFTPGHAPDHLCFMIEEEQNIFSGDNVLGIGTTVIPAETGNLGDYMDSLERILAWNREDRRVPQPSTRSGAAGPRCARRGRSRCHDDGQADLCRLPGDALLGRRAIGHIPSQETRTRRPRPFGREPDALDTRLRPDSGSRRHRPPQH